MIMWQKQNLGIIFNNMYLEQTPEQLSKVFVDNLLSTNRGFNYYVDWRNIEGFDDLMVEIHAIDILIGCRNDEMFKSKFEQLLSRLPSTIRLFPFLFGLAKEERRRLSAKGQILMVVQDDIDGDDNMEFSFANPNEPLTEIEINQYYDFFVRIGLKKLYQNIIEKSTLDYIVGVLVGLDSNGRKNRGGIAFELACLPVFQNVCSKYDLTLLTQKKFQVLSDLGFEVSEDIAQRKADFIVLDKNSKKAINFEVNFYNGSGSKPEEIIDSYINRQSDLKKCGIYFSLVTDGLGCWSDSNQIQKGFRHLDFLQNFHMLKHGMLEEIIVNVFDIQ